MVLSGCGRKQTLVKGIGANTYTSQDNHVYVDLKSTLDFGKTAVTPMSIPLKFKGKNYGTFTVLARLDGMADFIVSLDVTESFKLPATDPYLPNGSLLPIADLIYADSLVMIPVPNINTNVYLAAVNGRLIVGFAATIKGLDQLGSRLGTINVFPRFNISKIAGVAGIFVGDQAEESGIALFAAIENLFPEQVNALAFDRNLTYQQFMAIAEEVENPEEVYATMRIIDTEMITSQVPKKKQYNTVTDYLTKNFIRRNGVMNFVARPH